MKRLEVRTTKQPTFEEISTTGRCWFFSSTCLFQICSNCLF